MLVFFRLFFFLCFSFFLQNIAFAERALYVDDFDTILNNDTLKTNLLQYADDNDIEYLILYDLHLVHNQHDLTNATSNQILADFILDAKTNYNIDRIAAAGENAWFFEHRIMAYNATRTNALEKFDVLGMEFEFWTPSLIGPGDYYCTYYMQPNGLPCDSMGAFAFCKSQLLRMDTLIKNSSHPMTTEIYVGWPNGGQLHQIADIVDRTLIHAYVTGPNSAFNYALTRLQKYDTYNGVENISIIYSSEQNFMGPWLVSNSITAAEVLFMQDYIAATGAWKNHVNLEGFTYFTYTLMDNVSLPLELLSFKAFRENESDYLAWTIAHARDVKGFQVEQSGDGLSFELLGFVPFSDKSYYTFQLENKRASKPVGAYFRLKIMDLDGSFRYSDIVFLEKKNTSPIVLFPNPTQQNIHIKTTYNNRPFCVFDASGKVLLQGAVLPEVLDTQGFAKGKYWIKIGTENIGFEIM